VGGVVGWSDGPISATYAIADIAAYTKDATGKVSAGGLVGIYNSTANYIATSYAAGIINAFVTGGAPGVTTNAFVGGLIGQTPSATVLGVKNSVALQVYIASNVINTPVASGQHHRISGTYVSTGGPYGNYAFESMQPQASGVSAFYTDTTHTDGSPLTAVQAGRGTTNTNRLAFYDSQYGGTADPWDRGSVWKEGASDTDPYPKL
jgi:hypothetical protein